ncbi:MAG: TetR/AcrR family transcriptional regulator [Candidatus Lambdaproteobacteria bacterium]|nr:TetR/AcrR family transcriptional regulator [Candidatus Lambdaproteobacteria bacterium]
MEGEATKRRPGRPKDVQLAERRRGEILDVAVQLFARYGYRDTDVERIARALGVGKGTIYRYFPAKRTLFLDSVDRCMRELFEFVACCVPAEADPLEHMEQAVRAYLVYFDEHPEVVELLIQERAEFKERKQLTYFEYRERNQGHWREVAQQLVAEGRVRDVPFAQVSEVFGYLIYGAMLTNYFKGREKPIEQQARDILHILWFGVLSDEERHRRLTARKDTR